MLLMQHDVPNYVTPIISIMCHLCYLFNVCFWFVKLQSIITLITFRSCLISSSHVCCGLPLGRLTFLRYSASASLAGVSGCNLMRWPTQLRRRLCIVTSAPLFSFDFGVRSMLVIFLGQCMPRIFLRCLLLKVFIIFSSFW